MKYDLIKTPAGQLLIFVHDENNQHYSPGTKVIGVFDHIVDAESTRANLLSAEPNNVPAPKVKSYFQDRDGIIYPFNKIVYVGDNTEVVFSNDIRRIPVYSDSFEEAYLLWLDAQ